MDFRLSSRLLAQDEVRPRVAGDSEERGISTRLDSVDDTLCRIEETIEEGLLTPVVLPLERSLFDPVSPAVATATVQEPL